MTKKAIERALIEKLGCRSVNIIHGSGGSVLNECSAYKTDKGKFFIKHNKSNALKMYEAEAFALRLISKTNTLRVPEVIYCGLVDDTSFLVLEYIDLYSHTEKSQEKLGHQLATLHSSTRKKVFGFDINNTIGTTPQINDWSNDWTSFFCDYRLTYLLDIIHKKFFDEELLTMGNQLILEIPKYFCCDLQYSALLHGDLWGGNTAADSDGNPVIFDPASYYGHDECDLSIAMMFGGFDQSFFSSYHEIIPPKPGYKERNLIYQLYHYLNHYLLFGQSYRPSCVRILKNLI